MPTGPTRRALSWKQVASSPGLSIVERAGDLASAARAIRSGEAIGAVYVPADFERDLRAERRPQVVAFYNQQFLTAAGIASSSLSDSLAASSKRAVAHAAPKASRIGSLTAETIVLVNPQRNYAQFLLRALLPVVIHIIVTHRRRLCGRLGVSPPQHAHLACLRGRQSRSSRSPASSRRYSRSFFVIMLTVPLMLEGLLGIAFKGDVANGHHCRLAVPDQLSGDGRAVAAPGARSRDSDWALPASSSRLHSAIAGVGFPIVGMNAFALDLERIPAAALVHGGAVRSGGARIADPGLRKTVRVPGDVGGGGSTHCWRFGD